MLQPGAVWSFPSQHTYYSSLGFGGLPRGRFACSTADFSSCSWILESVSTSGFLGGLPLLDFDFGDNISSGFTNPNRTISFKAILVVWIQYGSLNFIFYQAVAMQSAYLRHNHIGLKTKRLIFLNIKTFSKIFFSVMHNFFLISEDPHKIWFNDE